MKSIVVAALVLLAMPHVGLAIIIRPDRDDGEYRRLAARYPAVCWIEAGGGTGTLIAPTWVLTAAHNVDNLSQSQHACMVKFGERQYPVNRIIYHPDHHFDREQRISSGVDLALLRLESPVADVDPIPLYVGQSESGQMATIIGYGLTGTFETGPPPATPMDQFVPTKRAGTSIIIQVNAESFGMMIDTLESATDLEAALAAGDSGGPALIQVDDRVFLAGVASVSPGGSGAAIRQTFGDVDSFVRVSTYARWIEKESGEDYGAHRTLGLWVFTCALLVVLAVVAVWFVRCRGIGRIRRKRAG